MKCFKTDQLIQQSGFFLIRAVAQYDLRAIQVSVLHFFNPEFTGRDTIAVGKNQYFMPCFADAHAQRVFLTRDTLGLVFEIYDMQTFESLFKLFQQVTCIILAVMIDHDKNVGSVLKKLDELGITKDTIVIYTTDNGPHMNSWPDAGMTPFRSEKNSNWEGAYRVPAIFRWTGKIKAGSVSNGITAHLDWLPTLLTAAGEPNIKEKLLRGYKAGNKEFKVHLDGYNFLPYFKIVKLCFFKIGYHPYTIILYDAECCLSCL